MGLPHASDFAVLARSSSAVTAAFRCVSQQPPGRTRSVTIDRAVPKIRSDRAAETRDFFVGLLGFDVAMDLGWVVTVARDEGWGIRRFMLREPSGTTVNIVSQRAD